jgi:hypothetical protein
MHLVVRNPLAGHRKPPNSVLQLTVPASRTYPAPVTTGQDNCRRPVKLIVVDQTGSPHHFIDGSLMALKKYSLLET